MAEIFTWSEGENEEGKQKNSSDNIAGQLLCALKHEIRNEFRAELDAVKNENMKQITALKEELAREKADKLLLLYKLETMNEQQENAKKEVQLIKKEFAKLLVGNVMRMKERHEIIEKEAQQTKKKFANLRQDVAKMKQTLENVEIDAERERSYVTSLGKDLIKTEICLNYTNKETQRALKCVNLIADERYERLDGKIYRTMEKMERQKRKIAAIEEKIYEADWY